eukprot:TRINITY_DN29174_c0_g1_i1.p1 TRINITY_DN29174_c0_g1~~TRINITY_DN29174_c0_g1_i1.p1  ORF type:complete len:207 (+),score=7.64 TRINITY_DN29174_c0_g1_i1:69-623(+)
MKLSCSKDWVRAVSKMLTGHKGQHKGPQFTSTDELSTFECVSVPDVPVSAYLRHIMARLENPDTWMAVPVLIKRLKDAGVPLTPYTAHRVLLGAVIVCDKCCTDLPYSNKVYAKIGLTTLADVNLVERLVLRLTDFKVHVTAAEANEMCGKLLPAVEKPSSVPTGGLVLPPLDPCAGRGRIGSR